MVFLKQIYVTTVWVNYNYCKYKNVFIRIELYKTVNIKYMCIDTFIRQLSQGKKEMFSDFFVQKKQY